MIKVKLSELISPSFYEIHKDIKSNSYTHYWLKGGRGSTKSSFASIEIVLGMMNDANKGNITHAVVIRKVKDTLAGSVVEQIIWAIEKLGVKHLWNIPKAKLEITYIPTGQKIIFRGADDPIKLKSIKVAKGYIKYIWYEELDQFSGMEEIRSINQSLMRGGDDFIVLYTYNPPKSVQSWVNLESTIKRRDRIVHHSDYREVPKEWLGEQFFIEAEHLKKVNPTAYKHEYLGEVTGTGGEIFTNVTIREITDEEIKIFDRIKRGIDWGYAIDPFVYIKCHYDKTRRKLYIFDEIYKVGLSNRKAAEMIKEKDSGHKTIIADSAEPKSIAEMKSYGIRIRGARKGPDSVDYGIKFLQDLEEIIIDGERCPNAAREFLNYELERDKDGNFKAEFPDKNNHTIDAVRYALEDETFNRKLKTINKRKLGL